MARRVGHVHPFGSERRRSIKTHRDPSRRAARRFTPKVPPERGTQFGLRTLLVVMSLGGPVVAAIMMLPRETLTVISLVVAAVSSCFVFAFGLSYCRPRWAFLVLIVVLLFAFAAHVAFFTDRLSYQATWILLTTAWALTFTTFSGAILSYSRHLMR